MKTRPAQLDFRAITLPIAASWCTRGTAKSPIGESDCGALVEYDLSRELAVARFRCKTSLARVLATVGACFLIYLFGESGSRLTSRIFFMARARMMPLHMIPNRMIHLRSQQNTITMIFEENYKSTTDPSRWLPSEVLSMLPVSGKKNTRDT
jgi:hypothetical protein